MKITLRESNSPPEPFPMRLSLGYSTGFAANAVLADRSPDKCEGPYTTWKLVIFTKDGIEPLAGVNELSNGWPVSMSNTKLKIARDG